jgi:hypothetical protein
VIGIGLIAVILAACNAGATSAPGSSADPGSSAGPTGGPGLSFDPGELPGFGAATTALDALDSYRYNVQFTSVDAEAGADGITIMSGIVVNQPEDASRTDMIEKAPDGSITSQTSFILAGNQAWTSDDGETWEAIPAEMAPFITQIFEAFRPEQIFSLYFAPATSGFGSAGQEEKNGIASVHYRADESAFGLFGTLAGFDASWEADVWLAVDGGHLVSSIVRGQGSDGELFEAIVDITNVNDPANAIIPPG